jgi:hypothetical protein
MSSRRIDGDPFGLGSRGWVEKSQNQAAYWRDWKRRNGTAGGIRIGHELWRQARATRPDWPTSVERREDLACHLRVIDELARASARRR